jgi:transposase
MQTLHRARSRLAGERTALINQLRAVLLERGITVAQGRRKLDLSLDGEDAPSLPLSPRMLLLIDDIRAQWRELDRRIAASDAEFVAAARIDPTARRLVTIPGIGAINATALVAAVGDARSGTRAAPAGATTQPKLTFKSDHQTGADHWYLRRRPIRLQDHRLGSRRWMKVGRESGGIPRSGS